MQKIYFKKVVDLNHQLKELSSISVDESIQYKMESQGMRALGSIMINGEYKDSLNKHQFHESIELDLFALFDKIVDRRDFHVKVEDFDYHIVEGNLSLIIQTCVYGVKDDEDRVIETQDTVQVVDEIEKLLREDTVDNDDVSKSFESSFVNRENDISKSVEQPIINKDRDDHEIEVMEDEDNKDDEDIGVYYLYVVHDGDTYQSIGQHYAIDENDLRTYNHERPLTQGTIVIIPYHS